MLRNLLPGEWELKRCFDDLRRVNGIGLAAAEKIIKAYPAARFTPGVHEFAAEMTYFPGSDSKDAVRKALQHVNAALSLDPESKKNGFYRGLMHMKGVMLGKLGEEAACMQVYDELLKDADSKTRRGDEYARVQGLIALGKKAEAEAELERIIKNGRPDSYIVKAARTQLDELRKPDGKEQK